MKEYQNFKFLDPLVFDMCSKNWRYRRDINECKELFENVVSEQPWYALRWRLKKIESSKSSRFLQDSFSISRVGFHAAKNAIAWPFQRVLARLEIK